MPPHLAEDFDAENIVQKRTKQLYEDYVVELLCEHGNCDRIIGWGRDADAARKCYDATVKNIRTPQ